MKIVNITKLDKTKLFLVALFLIFLFNPASAQAVNVQPPSQPINGPGAG
jgi:hypothetical protein